MALYIPHSIFYLVRLLYVRPETFGPYYVVMYKAKVAVCSEIRTKRSKQSEHPVEFLNVKPGGT